MSKVVVTKEKLDAIGESIRAKTGSTDKYTLDEMPTAIGSISGGGSDPLDPIEYRETHRDANWPYIPLPKEMKDTSSAYYEAGDCTYLLYDASGAFCCPAFIMNGTDVRITAYKYMNTELVSSSTEVVGTINTTKYMQFDDSESDFSSYNYLLLKITGSFTSLSINLAGKYGDITLSDSSSFLFEVSSKMANQLVTGMNSKNYKMVYFSATGTPAVDISNMFYNCYSLTAIPQLDTSNVMSMASMFNSCSSLQTIPQLDTSNVTNMNGMFNSCSSLQTIPQLDTSNVINMSSMFSNCFSLRTIPQLDTSNVTNMNGMFSNCYSLTTIPQLDIGKATDMGSMFKSCYSLTAIPQLDTSNVTNMMYMFLNCYSLKKADISHYTNSGSIFQYCGTIKKLILRDLKSTSFGSNMLTSCYRITGATNSKYNPQGLKDGFIYVPDDMVETLKTTTGWSTYASQIKGLSELD